MKSLLIAFLLLVAAMSAQPQDEHVADVGAGEGSIEQTISSMRDTELLAWLDALIKRLILARMRHG